MTNIVEQIVRIVTDGEETRAEVIGKLIRCKDCALYGTMCETDQEAYCSEARPRKEKEDDTTN